jgi:hypothetical protein
MGIAETMETEAGMVAPEVCEVRNRKPLRISRNGENKE